MAVGAYATALLTTRASMPFLLAVLISVLLSGLLGAIVGYAALRLKGSYLAMASLAVGAAIYSILNADLSLGGANGLYGIPPIKILSWSLISPEQQYFFVAVVLVVVSSLCAIFISTRHGWELRAMRDDVVAAQLIGVNITVRKVEIFALSAALGGLAGSLSASMQGVIDPTQFAPSVSITLFVIVAIGGMGSISGAVFGSALVYYVTQEISGSGLYALTALGAIVILLMTFVPGGLASIPRRVAQSRFARRAYGSVPFLTSEGPQ
jgi:branched-chain amino acid transport system permease protein